MDKLSLFEGGLEKNAQHTGDVLSFQKELYQLLARQTALYTSIDSSSVRVETAQELLQSICFTLKLDLDTAGQGAPATGALGDLFAQGQQEIHQKISFGKELWQMVCDNLPPVENRSLRDTLRSMGTFWRRYDSRFFAHQIPCDIDYQLCWPVDESVLGIDYINTYLTRLWMEHRFLNRFSAKELIPVLNAYCPDYQGLLINLYEPIATNVIGLAILGEHRGSLLIPDDKHSALQAYLADLPKAKLEEVLAQGAESAAYQLELTHKSEKDYFMRLAKELVPRILAVRDHGGLHGIFLGSNAFH